MNEPGDPEARATRLQGQADRAQGRADERRNAVHQILGRIPPSQPILRHHPGGRRMRRDLARVEGHEKALRAEQGKADPYAWRVEGAERRGRQQQDAGVIARRIAELEAEQRKCGRLAERGASSPGRAARWVTHLGQRIEHEKAHLGRITGKTGQQRPQVPGDFRIGQHVATVRGQAQVLKITPKKVKVCLLEGESLHLPGPFREWLEQPDRLRATA